MIELRLYRAALLPAVVAAVLAAFSLTDRPPPLPQALAADVLFEGEEAVRLVRDIVRAAPDRRPGTPGDRAIAELVRGELDRRGFDTTVDRFAAEGRDLANVVGRRVGSSERQIVLMAGRDAAGVPDAAASAADTAALLELARVLQGRPVRKTVVVASVGGVSVGDAGARRFAETVADPGLIDGVIVISNFGAGRGPGALEAWSGVDGRGSLGLLRTAASSLRIEAGRQPGGESVPGQVARLAFPLGMGAQAPLLERGIEAIRFSGSGELPPSGEIAAGEVEERRLEQMGRAVLRTASALETSRPLEHGPAAYVLASRRVVPGWALTLLAATLILPALVVSVDAFARVRRRREPVGPWVGWALAGVLPFALALVAAELLSLAGALPDAPPAPLDPAAEPLDGAGRSALGAVAAVLALGMLVARPWAIARSRVPAPATAGAAAVTAFALSLTVVVTWLINPFAALLLAPALNLWAVTALSQARLGPGAAALVVLGGVLLPLLVGVYYLDRLNLGPVEGAWYLMLLVTGHHVGLASSLLGCALLGGLLSLVATLVARGRGPRDEPAVTVRGPVTYAGPGSLGGTDSALRR